MVPVLQLRVVEVGDDDGKVVRVHSMASLPHQLIHFLSNKYESAFTLF